MDRIVYEKFDSLEQFVSVIGRRTENEGFRGLCLESKSGGFSFTGTWTYEESVDILKSGYKDGLKKINEAATKKARGVNLTERMRPHQSVYGFAPIVPNAILGLPQSMIARDNTGVKAKVISICYGISTNSGQKTSDIARAGANIMGLIRNLERQGYRVELRAIKGSCETATNSNAKEKEKWCAISSVKIKSDRQPANPLKIAYAMMHPSYSRRQCFRWLETQPQITTRAYGISYGRTMYGQYGNGDGVRKFLSEHKVLGKNDYYIDMNEAMYSSPDELMNLLRRINKNFK